MDNEMLLFLLKSNIALAGAVVLVLMLRRPVRAAFGAGSAYALWLIVPLSMLALLVPARTIHLPVPVRIASFPSDTATMPGSSGVSVGSALDDMMLSNLPLPKLLLAVWLVVALAQLLVQAERQRRFVHSLGNMTIWNGILWSDRVGVGPAVVGAIHPRIVVPADFVERFTREEQALILAHERTHLRRGDARINAVATGLQCLFWFNPFAYLGASVMRVDQEIACDAAVLSRHPKSHRTYGDAMLKTQLAPAIPLLGCHWPASVRKQLKERFTLLATHRNSHRRNLVGGVAVGALSLMTGISAWAAQPANLVHEAAGNPTSRALQDPLIDAVRAGNISAVQSLISGGANVNVSRPGDGSPLIEAARNGKFDIAELLLAAGADPRMAVPGDGAPLLQAASSGDLQIVRLLVARGADVEQFVPGDETPLIKAAQSGDLDVVTYLVDRGANVKRAVQADAGRMRSPLSEARRNGHDAVARYLVGKGA